MEDVSLPIQIVRALFVRRDMRALSKLIDTHLIPHQHDKQANSEVSTPFELRKQMLDSIPDPFWTSPKKVLEPCAGKGGFVVDLVDRFMVGLKDAIPDDRERYKVVVEECVHFCDINPTNVFLTKLLIDPFDEHQLNFFEGSTLELDAHQQWGLTHFDCIVGNPPYNAPGKTKTGNNIWQHFTRRSLAWLTPNGYLVFVHPPGWRKPCKPKCAFEGLFRSMTHENQMLSLSIHSLADGKSTFGCGTAYDWYIIEKTPAHKPTKVIDQIRKTIHLDLSQFEWLPNYNLHLIQPILAKGDQERCPIIYNRSTYPSDNKHNRIATTQSAFHPYPVVHTFPAKEGVRYLYSNDNTLGHFGVPKVIFGQFLCKHPILDMVGEYGMSEHSMAIPFSTEEDGRGIYDALRSDTFQLVWKSCFFSTQMFDWRFFTFLKKDFWKEFV